MGQFSVDTVKLFVEQLIGKAPAILDDIIKVLDLVQAHPFLMSRLPAAIQKALPEFEAAIKLVRHVDPEMLATIENVLTELHALDFSKLISVA